MTSFTTMFRVRALAALLPLAMLAAPAAAQDMQSVDPNTAIDGDLMDSPGVQTAPADQTIGGAWDGGYASGEASARYETRQDDGSASGEALDLPPQQYSQAASEAVTDVPGDQAPQTTYAEDDLIGAAEGLFGRGAEGLARLIQGILAEQGEPNGYIVGREGGGAFVLGVRYGSGTLYHAVEGNMPVYWTGPSIGADVGANAGNTFVLVYNLNDTDQLYERFPAGEGAAYLVGGFNASYVRKGDVVLIPIRVGAGLRLGLNAGYLRFSRNQRWLPF
ncbi:DUF1134 domain-containing protein [Erythrobacter arachoides]|uniref:DUF1134 domain-containing protein n=1 Tax=Aurantiacibacter arachoides TaxID=1850444 RepID=A0A845A0T9_9SPHN|nr:DUF1134 domain-containing protein [Aurantiacibacter arachoides]MXO94113.1 DUF1134 domain-containing protein [Aurantiacibacter arachoides]